jgi:hypothetical protein
MAPMTARSLVLVAGLLLSAACATPSGPSPEAAAAQARATESERIAEAARARAEKDAARRARYEDLEDTYDAANLLEMPALERAEIQCRALHETARMRLEDGDVEAAAAAIEKAIDVARYADATALRAALSDDRFLIRRVQALELARSGDFDGAERLFDRIMLWPDLRPDQKSTVAGDRLVLMESRGDGEAKARQASLQAALDRILGPSEPPPTEPAETAMASPPSLGKRFDLELPTAALPSSREGPAAETGRFDRSAVLKVVSANKRAVTLCYEQSLKRGERLRGKLDVSVTIATSGEVEQASVANARLARSEMARCLTSAVRRWRFPPFEGEPVELELPFLLNQGL